jgi:hypothetical protein
MVINSVFNVIIPRQQQPQLNFGINAGKLRIIGILVSQRGNYQFLITPLQYKKKKKENPSILGIIIWLVVSRSRFFALFLYDATVT